MRGTVHMLPWETNGLVPTRKRKSFPSRSGMGLVSGLPYSMALAAHRLLISTDAAVYRWGDLMAAMNPVIQKKAE